jgi:hypothetical protein
VDFVSFKYLGSDETARKLAAALEHAGGIFVPEIIDDMVPYTPEQLRRSWRRRPVHLLRRRQPSAVEIVVLSDPDRLVRTTIGRSASQRGLHDVPVLPSHLSVVVDETHLSSVNHIEELIRLGEHIYELASPCYGFLTLPWLPRLHDVASPERGLPGWGWATWLGPEYDEILPIPANRAIEVTRKPDGGRLIRLPFPNDLARGDPASLLVYRQLVENLNSRVFQAKVRKQMSQSLNLSWSDGGRVGGDPVIVPKFRTGGDLLPEN